MDKQQDHAHHQVQCFSSEEPLGLSPSVRHEALHELSVEDAEVARFEEGL